MKFILRLVAILGLAVLAQPAAAIETGSAGWLISAQTLYQGPGAGYRAVGDLEGEIAIRVDRCSGAWCNIRAYGISGWVPKVKVSFGQEPRGPFTGPRLNYPAGGTVCFYEGYEYTGAYVCSGPGTVVTDLLKLGLDNLYASVKVQGGSATVCRDRDFSSYCERIIEDQPALDRLLARAVSSYRVW